MLETTMPKCTSAGEVRYLNRKLPAPNVPTAGIPLSSHEAWFAERRVAERRQEIPHRADRAASRKAARDPEHQWPHSFIRRFAASTNIFEQGDPGHELFVVLSGKVSIRKSIGGMDQELALLGAGEFFGEMAIIDRQPRSASAVAGASGAELLAVDLPHFMYLVTQQPAFAMIVMQALCKRQRDAGAVSPAFPLKFPDKPGYDVTLIGDGCFQLCSRSRSCNTYLFKGTKKNILVDTSLPSSADLLCATLSELGTPPTDIDIVVLTHEHFDHIGAAPAFSGNAIIASLGLTATKINLNDEFATLQQGFGEVFTPFTIDWELAPDALIDNGLHQLRVLHTPGHTSGSMSLLDQQHGTLVSGDTVMRGGPIGGVFVSGNICDMIYSLNHLRTLDSRMLLPGHGPISDAPKNDIDLTLARSRSLLTESQTMFDALQRSDEVDAIIDSYRRLNRGLMKRNGAAI
jgi:hydroxyacylglutathione hydrolase